MAVEPFLVSVNIPLPVLKDAADKYVLVSVTVSVAVATAVTCQ